MTLNTEFNVKIKRTNRRKTISLQVIRGYVIVTVPNLISDKVIEELILKKSKWIRNKLTLLEKAPVYKKKQFINGEYFLYMGRKYRMRICNGTLNQVKLKNGNFILTINQKTKSLKDNLERWFKKKAQVKLSSETLYYAKSLGLTPMKISIKGYKSRWGSCNSRGEISFNWRIIMAPKSVINYVVIHELCHLKYHDHSDKFWGFVESNLPSYREQRDWLKCNETLLEW